MALRLIEIQLPKDKEPETRQMLTEFTDSSVWEFTYSGDLFFAKVVISAEDSERIMDAFEKKYAADEHFRLILHSLEAMIPRLPEKKADAVRPPEPSADLERVSREELYHDIDDACKLNRTYLIMVALSAIVASIGIMRQNVPALIGSMVIAPLLGPNVALSFAATLGDLRLAARALWVNVVGCALALAIALTVGWVSRGYIAAHINELQVVVNATDILLALSAGAAGALAFTTGVSAVLIGVMVAVALLPPLVNFGMFAGSGHWPQATAAFWLVTVNVISVNLAGIVTFYFQNVRALTWWEEGKARKLRTTALAIWIGLLLLLLLVLSMIQ